jgi:hypothetical protein
VSDYVGRVAARDDGEGRTLATWSSRFRNEKANEAEIATDLESFYRTGQLGDGAGRGNSQR